MATSLLSDVCTIDYGTRVVKSRDLGTKYDVYGGGGRTFRVDRWNREDSMIVSRFGMSPLSVRFVTGKFFLNDSGLTVSTKDDTIISQEYINWFLLFANNQIFSLGRGSAQRNLDIKAFGSLKINYPQSVKDQQKIVGKLDSAFKKIDQAIQLNSLNIKNSQFLFKSTLEEIFTDKNTSLWRTSIVSDLGRVQTGTTPKTSDRHNYGDFIPFIKPSDFKPNGTLKYDNDGLSEKGLTKGRLINAYSVLMVCIGATITKTGYCDRDISCNQQINAVSLGDKILAKFVYYQMTTNKFKTKILNEAPKTTLPIINKGNWSKLQLKVPSNEEVQSLVAKLDKLSSESEHLTRSYVEKSNRLNMLKVSLLNQAFAENVVR